MNYRGSYRKLLGNAKAVLIAAIEIYNKPAFQYRDECFVILLLNAWELGLKALLFKNKQSIYYRKKRHQPYRTLSWQDALTKAKTYFPKGTRPLPVQYNLELIGTYRDNAVHFYNADGFGIVIYALAQTCIKNLRDLMEAAFAVRLEEEINWQLLPLGIKPPIDVVSYILGKSGDRITDAIRQFLSELAKSVEELKAAGEDTGRLLTVFNVKLESVKKIGDADVVVGVEKADGIQGPLVVVRTQDPNKTHRLRRKGVLARVQSLHGKRFTSHVFQAIVWKHHIKENQQYCWRAEKGWLTLYSYDFVTWLKRLTAPDIEAALKDYRQYLASRRRNHTGGRRSK
ncbi:MAG: DUF3644 domain-containing protein [Planctomycetes bacterium]|nr:DUF3644 domain-containing protein [Planctomycetota bacterium]